jgi:hypothetical protein
MTEENREELMPVYPVSRLGFEDSENDTPYIIPSSFMIHYSLILPFAAVTA